MRVIGEPLLKVNMSTSSMAAQTQEEQRAREDVVRVKDETDVCSVAAQTLEEVCTREVTIDVKVESLLEDTVSTYSVAAHQTESSREVVCEDPSWIETAACSVSVPQEKECPMVLVHVKVEPKDTLMHAQEDACSMEEVAVKEEPLWTETEATCSTQHTRENCSREEACMKKELPLEASCYVTMTSQADEQMQKQTTTYSTRVHTQNLEQFSEEVVSVQEELMNAADFCGVSSAAARAGLYAGHAVKDELVVGPECLQPPDAVFARDAVLRQWRSVRHDHRYARRAPELELLAIGMKACCVKLERCDRLLTPRPLTEPSPSTRTSVYECDTCAKTYPYKSKLVGHIQTHLKSKVPKSKRKQATDTIQEKGRTLKKEKTFSCQTCSKKFARKQHLERHNLIHEGLKPHICLICNKGFRHLENLKRHGRIHTGEKLEKPYSCDVCNKTFAQSGNLTAHQRIHMNLRPYICEICNNRFRESGALVKHKRTHTKEKPFHCTICRKSFTQSQRLKIHQRIHSGEKPYSCDICTERFRESSSLKKHKNTHFRKNQNKKQLHCCTICLKSFARPCTLRIHQRIHSGEKPYSCEICMERFSRRDTLLHHVLAHAGKGPLANRKAKKSTDCFS